MKLLVLGDIHGNLTALQCVVEKYFKEVDKVICHGDVVNYGPWSNECVELLDFHNVECLLGNHEDAYIAGYYPGHNEMVKKFFSHTFRNFNNMEKIESYKKQLKIEDILITHTINDTYYYPDTNIDNLVLKSHTIIGHSHYPFIRNANNSKLFINTGSVGQNRKDLSIINFAMIDTLTMKAEIMDLKYNPLSIINEMEAQGYPLICINYYKSKL